MLYLAFSHDEIEPAIYKAVENVRDIRGGTLHVPAPKVVDASKVSVDDSGVERHVSVLSMHPWWTTELLNRPSVYKVSQAKLVTKRFDDVSEGPILTIGGFDVLTGYWR